MVEILDAGIEKSTLTPDELICLYGSVLDDWYLDPKDDDLNLPFILNRNLIIRLDYNTR